MVCAFCFLKEEIIIKPKIPRDKAPIFISFSSTNTETTIIISAIKRITPSLFNTNSFILTLILTKIHRNNDVNSSS